MWKSGDVEIGRCVLGDLVDFQFTRSPGHQITRSPDVLVGSGSPHGFGAIPVFVQDCPQRLIEILSTAKERFSQGTLLHRSDLAERSITSTVLHGCPRFESVDTNDIKGKVDDELRPCGEQARAPER